MSTTCCGDRRFNDSATRCADVAGGTEHEASASDSADSASDTDTKSPPTACSSSCTSSCVARTTSSLKDAVRTALSQLLEERKTSHDDISQDVYRAIRDEAQLLLERQKIADCLDSDPFGLMKYESAGDDTVNNKATVERVKVNRKCLMHAAGLPLTLDEEHAECRLMYTDNYAGRTLVYTCSCSALKRR